MIIIILRFYSIILSYVDGTVVGGSARGALELCPVRQLFSIRANCLRK